MSKSNNKLIRDEISFYSWYIDEAEKDVTVIRAYGLDKLNRNVCLRIHDFYPYVYLELPNDVIWDIGKVQLVSNKLDILLGNQKPIAKSLTNRKKLYGVHINTDKTSREFAYLKCEFSSKSDIKTLGYKVRTPLTIPGLGRVQLKIHESDADPVLQFTSKQKIPTAGWAMFIGKRVPESDKITLCDKEYFVNHEKIVPVERTLFPKPKSMGFDLEVNSSNPSAMPDSSKPADKIFQISCILSREGEDEKEWKRYILSLGDPNQKVTGDNAIIKRFKTEADLLIGFTELVRKKNPNILMGYNIFGFDIPYMIDRAKMLYCLDPFDKLGFHKYNSAKEKTLKWSSAAYGDQSFAFLDAEGRVFVDLLPLVKRDYKMNNYRLKTISDFFLGETKDDLSPQGIFKCYRIGMKKGSKKILDQASKALGIVAKYCLQDSVLVVKLFHHLKSWAGLCAMANVCCVPIFVLYTQGQQIKVYSQIYKYCYEHNIVVEKDAYVSTGNDRYMGAHVFDAVPGVYDDVIPLDFASLYPTTIIAYNLDYSTECTNNPDIPDRDCHIFVWEDHCYCIAKDTKVSLSYGSKNIQELQDSKELVYGISKTGVQLYNQTNYFNRGVKECVELTFQDGTTLKCTPDHRIMNSKGEWVEAQNLTINESVKMTIRHPDYLIDNDYALIFGGELYTGDNLIKLSQLIGLICSDGHLVKGRSMIYVGHQLDIDSVSKNIKDVLSIEPKLRKENYGWSFTILGEKGEAFRTLEGVSLLSKGAGRSIPDFVINAPEGIVCAFLSGLYGGDGHTLSFSKQAGAFSPIGFSWTEDYTGQLIPIFEKITFMLERVGFHPTVTTTFHKLTSKTTRLILIPVSETLLFHEKIGFAHCVHKSTKLEAGCLYLRHRQNVWDQQQRIVNKYKDIRDNIKAQGKRAIVKDILKPILKDEDKGPIFNSFYAHPTEKQITEFIRSRRKVEKPMFSREHFPGPLEYMDMIGVRYLFDCDKKGEKVYGVDKDSVEIPVFNVPLIHRKNIGMFETYDIEVSESHSFVANGIIVHNCEHDPKVIHRNELTNIINNKRDKVKELRAKKKNKKLLTPVMLKTVEEQIKLQLEEITEYVIERSEIVKSKPKFPMCEKRRFRFLKEPMGVLPTILQGLLNARGNTRKEIFETETRLKNATTEEEKAECESLLVVLDKRQLAFKVSANSGYGITGVKRGYLPFPPIAMTTTYMGRTNIFRVSQEIQNTYGGKLIYGDTDCVSSLTPILILTIDNKIKYKTVEQLSDGNWTRINPHKEMSKVKSGYKVWSDWGFTNIINVVRCNILKPINRVLTHTGVVDCSDEHSLLTAEFERVKPKNVNIGDKLAITSLPIHSDTPSSPVYNNKLTEQVIREYDIPNVEYEGIHAELAFAWGIFFADGSCGTYMCSNGYNKNTWAINKKDNTLLERCQDILSRREIKFKFKILNTMKSSHVNKLVAVLKDKKGVGKECIENLVIKYRKLFYDKRKYKRVPHIILRAPLPIRQAFFMGYYAGDGSKKDPAISLTNKGAIGSAGLFYLMKSIGYNVSVNTRSDKQDTYKLTGSNPAKKQRKAINAVKKNSPIVVENADNEYIYDIQTDNGHFSAGVGELVVHNSNYVHFPNCNSVQETWDYSIKVAAEISKLFPPPIKLEFEKVIYKRFFLLRKKKYMYLSCVRDGIVSDKVGKKGVLLARRDNSKIIRDIYEVVIEKIFNKEDRDSILYYIMEKIKELCSGCIPVKDFVITKSIKSTGDMDFQPFVDDKGKKKIQIGSYKVTALDTDPEKRRKQMALKGCTSSDEYYSKGLPAQVQLAEKMRRRGQLVDVGTRLEYVITDIGLGEKCKQYDQIEDYEYFMQHKDVLKIDYLYYIKLLSNPMDQVLDIIFPRKNTDPKKGIIHQLYNFMAKKRKPMLQFIENINTPTLTFKE